MGIRLSPTVRYVVCAGIVVLVLVAIAGMSAQQESGTVTGVTLFVMKGHPGALVGKPDPAYKTPAPTIAPNEILYWLRVGGEKGKRLFVVQSDGDGKFQIELPPGEYCVEPAFAHASALRQMPSQQRDEEEMLIQQLFPSWRLQGKPDVKVEKGKIHSFDVEARVLYID